MRVNSALEDPAMLMKMQGQVFWPGAGSACKSFRLNVLRLILGGVVRVVGIGALTIVKTAACPVRRVFSANFLGRHMPPKNTAAKLIEES
jgi:hypothetical protein